MKIKLGLSFILLITSILSLNAQSALFHNKSFTRQDTLRGSITPEREWWDLTYYHLDIKVDPDKKYISGKNTIQYKVLKNKSIMQIDLQAPLKLTKAIQNDKELLIQKDGNAHFITLIDKQNIDDIKEIEVYYNGKPKEAINAPWDGGISWKKDANNNHFIASSCQGLGASAWWPNKDHLYDEVDSMLISVNVPSKLTNVSNGRLRLVEQFTDTKTFHWFIKNPINNYGVSINIANYTNFYDVYNGQGGKLDLNYYVLKENLDKAKIHFKQVPKIIEAFEYWFGQYPFVVDSYKLVEVPYLGMEHQSCVSYGNQYKNGYLGRDLSGTGWGLKFDFILVHETGHEWFGNSITNKDAADMWIHEGFTSYSESLFIEYYYGKEAAADYVIGTRKNITNNKPIIGEYNLNSEGSIDMYFKGANIIHTLRQLVDNDEKWRHILRKLNLTFYHKTVTTQEIETFLSQETHINLTPFFNQYLRDTRIPTLEYFIKKNTIKYRWKDVVNKFEMPIQVLINNKKQWLSPQEEWKTLKIDSTIKAFKIDRNFFVKEKKHL